MTSAKIIVQSQDAESAELLAALLEPYHHEVHTSVSSEDTALLARCAGPFDLVLAFDRCSRSLREQLRELSRGTKLIELPALQEPSSASAAEGDVSGLLFDPSDLLMLVERALGSGGEPRRAAVDQNRFRDVLVQTIVTYSLLLEKFQFVNGGNSALIREYALQVGRELGLSSTHMEEVGMAALLQDIGLFVPTRTGRGAAEARRRRLHEHPIRGANLVQRLKLPWSVRHIILTHHEWYNGFGYPTGIQGREIPLGARILAAVNAFFSMISARPGRPALGLGETIEELNRLAGNQLDPEVVEIMVALMRKKAFTHGAGRRRIAVLSADPALLAVVQQRFEDADASVRSLAAGRDALGLVRAFAPHAVIVDSTLGDMNGFQFLHWLRKDAALAQLPVVVVSGEEEGTPEAFMAHDMGADDFLLKRHLPNDIVARVYAHIRRRERIAGADSAAAHDGEGIRGSVDEMRLAELVGMLAEHRKTATVAVSGPGVSGQLVVDGGVLVHAETGTASGDEAFRELLRWGRAGFVVEYGIAGAKRTVRGRLDRLLLEAERERRAEAGLDGDPVREPAHAG